MSAYFCHACGARIVSASLPTDCCVDCGGDKPRVPAVEDAEAPPTKAEARGDKPKLAKAEARGKPEHAKPEHEDKGDPPTN